MMMGMNLSPWLGYMPKICSFVSTCLVQRFSSVWILHYFRLAALRTTTVLVSFSMKISLLFCSHASFYLRAHMGWPPPPPRPFSSFPQKPHAPPLSLLLTGAGVVYHPLNLASEQAPRSDMPMRRALYQVDIYLDINVTKMYKNMGWSPPIALLTSLTSHSSL